MANSPQELWSGWSEQQYRAWQKQRRRGPLLHIFVRAILRYGVPIFAANYALRRWGGHMVMDGPWWVWTISVLTTLCVVTGLAEWLWNEKQFRIVTALRQKARDVAAERVPANEPQS